MYDVHKIVDTDTVIVECAYANNCQSAHLKNEVLSKDCQRSGI